MTRGVQEGDLLACRQLDWRETRFWSLGVTVLDITSETANQTAARARTQKGADVLRDPARLRGHDLAPPQTVEQGGLPVIHVAHDSDHRGAGHQAGWVGWRSGGIQVKLALLYNVTSFPAAR